MYVFLGELSGVYSNFHMEEKSDTSLNLFVLLFRNGVGYRVDRMLGKNAKKDRVPDGYMEEKGTIHFMAFTRSCANMDSLIAGIPAPLFLFRHLRLLTPSHREVLNNRVVQKRTERFDGVIISGGMHSV